MEAKHPEVAILGNLRCLLISDTHGYIDDINDYAEKANADFVIHAGDFGFYDSKSASRLSDRELWLRVAHDRHISKDLKNSAKRMKGVEMQRFVNKHARLSQLPDYLRGKKSFKVPVFAVWGNHEDKYVIDQFRQKRGGYSIDNLYLLDECSTFSFGPFHIFGVGGNLIESEHLFQKPIVGGGGKVFTSLYQLGQLKINLDNSAPINVPLPAHIDASKIALPKTGLIKILVTHVSPGKEPMVARLAAHSGARYAISGHMGSPYTAVWNHFTCNELGDGLRPLEQSSENIQRLWGKARSKIKDVDRDVYETGLKMLTELPESALLDEQNISSRRPRFPRWFRNTFFINLPDAHEGYAAFEYDGKTKRVTLETKSFGWNFP